MDLLKQEYDRLCQERQQKSIPKGKIIGTCQNFCPYFEIVERKLRNDISVFEKDIMVKKYVRSAAGKNKAFEEDVRPIDVLCSCFDHLIETLVLHCGEHFNKDFINLFGKKICNQPGVLYYTQEKDVRESKDTVFFNEFDLLEVYKFIEDRTRAIRLDISIQELTCAQTILLLQKICNFHIVFNFLLFDFTNFEEHLNVDQIRRIFLSLTDCYKLQRNIVLTLDQQRYYAYCIIMMINDIKKNNVLDVLGDLNSGINRETIRRYEVINDALSLFIEVRRGNIGYFFKFMKHTDFLTSCLMTTQLKFVRELGMDMFKTCFYEKINMQFLMSWLHIKDPNFLIKEGLKIEDDKICFKTRPFIIKEVHSELLPPFIVKPYNTLKGIITSNTYDIFIHKYIMHKYLDIIIRNAVNSKNLQHDGYISISQILMYVYREYAHKICISAILKFVYLRRRDLIAIWKEKSKFRTKRRKLLLVVCERTVSAAIFCQKIKKTFFKPEIVPYKKDLDIDEMLLYRLVLFVVAKNHHKYIETHYYMLSKIICLPSAPMIDLNQAIEHASYVVKKKIKDVVTTFDRNKTLIAMCELIENKRNPLLCDVLIKYEKHGILDNIDVYYEDNNKN